MAMERGVMTREELLARIGSLDKVVIELGCGEKKRSARWGSIACRCPGSTLWRTWSKG